ncbi:hypothetical protein NW762_005646 [Fusarium torreyae]|uniref:Zn(2)-C6 fungal-type domain-containing protein n=1 Tax=Fusarium torreyae TaxID=1237075 RepID=A0A9W8S3L3_9HYPO|nr:hypothetical protein NW762_005646 [Fusarium torreyae]
MQKTDVFGSPAAVLFSPTSAPVLTMEREHRVKKRAQKACGKCREDKVKCTGSYPCQRCVKRELTCNLNDDLGKNGIPKRYLRKLKLKAATTAEQAEFPKGQIDTGECSRLGTTKRLVEPDR